VAPPSGTFLGAVIELDLVGPTADRVGFTLQAPVTASGTEFPLLPRVGIPVGTVVPVQIDITPGNDIDFDFSAAGTSSFTSVPGGFNAYRFIDVNDVLPPIAGATIVAGRTTLGVTPDDISFTADSITINV
jgi:hypothetical protein